MNRLLIAALVLSADSASAADPKPVAIKPVKTWRDLSAQREVEVSKGVKARFGIETATAAAGEGMLVFCLMDQMPNMSAWKDSSLGPVFVEVRRDKAVRLRRAIEQMKALRVKISGPVLFAKAVHFPVAAKYTLEIKTSAGRVIARKIIRVSKKTAHPWTTFQPQAMKAQELRRINEPEKSFLQLGHSIATPDWSGVDPIPSLGQAKKNIALPRLLPQRPDPGFKLVGESSMFLISSKNEFEVGAMGSSLLARWWVNDKPFVPTKRRAGSIQWARKLTSAKRVHLFLKFDPKEIGAKPGDKIGLQLLHCPGGWKESHAMLRERVAVLNPRPIISRMTNKVEWRVPRGP